MSLRTLLFDLDGTLLDSFAAHFQAYRFALARFGICVDEAAFLNSYSPHWHDVYRAVGLAEEHWPAASALWLEEAARQVPRAYPGTLELVTGLSRRYALGLVTSGSRSRVERDLALTGLAGRFAVVITGDDVRAPKPDPEGLLAALAALGAAAHEALYVGDTPGDRAAARAAGMRFVWSVSRFAPPEPGCPLIWEISALESALAQL